MAIILDDPGERHDLHLRVDDRSPLVSDDRRWRYQASATPEDAVWLRMLAKKCATAQRLGRPAA